MSAEEITFPPLEGRVAVVTGGGTGIGRSISAHFARAGARGVVNYAHSREAAESIVNEIQSSGGIAAAVAADIRKQDQANTLMKAAIDRFGRLDYLINNAGWSKRVPHTNLEKLTDDVWDRV